MMWCLTPTISFWPFVLDQDLLAFWSTPARIDSKPLLLHSDSSFLLICLGILQCFQVVRETSLLFSDFEKGSACWQSRSRHCTWASIVIFLQHQNDNKFWSTHHSVSIPFWKMIRSYAITSVLHNAISTEILSSMDLLHCLNESALCYTPQQQERLESDYREQS